jgi:Fe-Mn family superoxide dismutase
MTVIKRRNLLTIAASVTVLSATPRYGLGQSNVNLNTYRESGPFLLPSLPYAPNALASTIDAETMSLHHDKHHATYVKNLNDAARIAPQIAEHTIDHVLANLEHVPESIRMIVRNNLGGHANHSMFWEIMGPGGGSAQGEVLAAIVRDFGDIDNMKADFNAAGARLFGSGWVFVTVTREGRLAIETQPNQDTPLMSGKRVLLGNDMWEHSYYLRYRNRRADYLKAWWDVVNWKKVGERYKKAKDGTLAI